MQEHKQILEQVHKENYIKAVQELIKSNTKALICDDITPLFDKPPLDSMDLIKNKLLQLAKEQKKVLEIEDLNRIIEKYQREMQTKIKKLGKLREEALTKFIKAFEEGKEDSIKILKKDLLQIDKQMQKEVKQTLEEKCDALIKNDLEKLFSLEEDSQDFIEKQMKEFMKKKYIKQILESLDIKILVKDTTLLNGLKEQTNRYVFTLENSHLFD